MYLSATKGKSYNILLIQAGHALPYPIYPNAVTPSEDGEWNYKKIEEIQKATIRARKNNLGIWAHEDILLPMELRFLTRREKPAKYCADLETNILYPPEHYFKVPIENRLFFYPRDAVLAVQHGFKPTPYADQQLLKIWNAFQEPQEQEDEIRKEIL